MRGILSVGVALSGTKHVREYTHTPSQCVCCPVICYRLCVVLCCVLSQRWALNIVGITLISALIVVLLHSNCCSLKGFVRARVALLLGYVWAFMGVMLQLGGVLHSAFTFTLIGVAGIFVISLIVFLLTPYVSQWRVKLCGGSARVEPSPSLDEGMDDDDTDHHTPLKHAPSSFNDNNGMIVDGVSGARSSVGSVSIQWGDDVTRTHSNGGGVGSSERRLIQMSTIEETAVS